MLRKNEKEHKQERKKGFKLFFTRVFFSVLLFSPVVFTPSKISKNITYAKEEQIEQNTNPDLESLEEKVFHQKYTKDSSEERINRLEEFLFGNKNTSEGFESRINKIKKALKLSQPQLKITESEKIETPEIKEPKVIYEDLGIVGIISQIENEVFNMTFNEQPFPRRVIALEEKILTRGEIAINRKKPLLERVSYLVQKSGLQVNKQIPLTLPSQKIENNNQRMPSQNYIIDPQTRFLINQDTNEIVKDSFGNPIRIMTPQYLPQQNYGFQPPLPLQQIPTRQIPGQLPLDLFNQGNYDPGY